MNSERDAADTGPSPDQPPDEELDDAPDLAGDGSGDNQRDFANLQEQDGDVFTDNPWAEGDTAGTENQPSSITPRAREDDEFGDYVRAQYAPPEAVTPDDTPSIQDSEGPASPRRTPLDPSAKSPLGSPAPSIAGKPRLSSPRHSLLPFDRRFQAKRSISGASSLFQNARGSPGPGHLTAHSRSSSISTQAFQQDRDSQNEAPDAPWEVVRWSRLGKLKAEVFSEAGKRKFGKVTCIAVTSSVALGTSKGILLVFDAKQQLKAIVGEATKAVEAGAITSIAISADHSTVAAGHANGAIFTWEIARPAKPFLQIPPSALGELKGTTKDGHVVGVAVLHLGFLGVRHTALVSADDKGMAFSHLATRGMGALGRSVKTTRILGRYPDVDTAISKPRKPSSVLGFAPLPMGTAEYGTDNMGLAAMLTPYLLVIVSTTPVAQTQHKIFRPKNVAPHSAMSGCLAWYPAMQNESRGDPTEVRTTVPKLAYCWSNVLSIIEVTEIQPDENEFEAPIELLFTEQHTWRSEEPLVAMQWLSRNILAVLTVSQQLIILEHPPLRATDASDLLRKHIYHVDLFSSHLGNMVEKLDEQNANMHGVVADAFYMSFKAYKGRLFLLGFDDIAIGTLSNWADRLFATMERGDYIGAIRQASNYFAGHADVASIGLPLSTHERQEVVGDKLLELMSASLRYAFGQNPDAVDRRAPEKQVEELAVCCFDACESLKNQDFLFEEVYASFAQADHESLFLDKLRERILVGQIQVVPPIVLKALVTNFADRDLHDALEELLVRLNPATMDLDQVTKLCKSHELFDALFYVWSQGISDYTTILGDLLDAIDRDRISEDSEADSKIFTYLSYTLTGRVYPTDEPMAEEQAVKAKAEMYAFLFSGSRPSADGKRAKLHNLRQLLLLDSAAFMSMLNEAFEDAFLNGAEDRLADDELGALSDEQKFGLSLNRQHILSILHDFMTPPDFENDDILFLDMFIARSLPKYPQYIMLRDSTMHRVLTELCTFTTAETDEDCQLSAEYLLSVYHPPDLEALVPILIEARFWRVIKTIYRSEGEYDKLLQTCINDTDNSDGIYECISDCLRPGAPLTAQQRLEFRRILESNLGVIVRTDVQKAASTLETYAPDLQAAAVDTLESDGHAKYLYLREIMEPTNQDVSRSTKSRRATSFNEQYVRLLCDFDPQHVRAYVETLDHGDLSLDAVLPALESSGMIDSAVVLLAREGQVRDGIERLVQHLQKLGSALQGLLESAGDAPDSSNIAESASDLIDGIEKYSLIGVWLCQRNSQVNTNGAAHSLAGAQQPKGKQVQRRGNSRHAIHDELLAVEALWLDLIDAIVQVIRTAGESLASLPPAGDGTTAIDVAASEERFRMIVQSTFTSLLRATTSAPPVPRFLPILRGFLNRASKSSPNLAHLRQVLGAIFSAYAFEEDILGLANRLLDKDLFVGVEDVSERRRRGWRPLGMACGGCGKKVWGPGAGKEIWDEWHQSHQLERTEPPSQVARRSQEALERAQRQDSSSGKGKGKEKGKAKAQEEEHTQAAEQESEQEKAEPVVVFACRHLFHRKCLHNLLGIAREVEGTRYSCPLEEADGKGAVTAQ